MPDIKNIFKNTPVVEMDEAKKKALLIYLAALLVLILFYFFVFLKPSLGTLFGLMPKVGERRSEIKQVTEDLKHKDRLETKVKALGGAREARERAFSKEKEIPILLENLSKTAKDSHVKMLGIRPIGSGLAAGPEKKEKNGTIYQEVPIAITAQSGYHELGKFINTLENDVRFMQISDLKIKSNANNPKRHDTEFVVYAYTLKESE